MSVRFPLIHFADDVFVASKVRYMVGPVSGTPPRRTAGIGASSSLRRSPAKAR